MKCEPTSLPWRAGDRLRAGFTLAEALAALAFMALVIPVAVQGLRIANLAGQVADRKAVAARIADALLNELVVTHQWQRATSGTVQQDAHEYRWQFRSESWSKDALKLLSLQVAYAVQGQDYTVRLSTLVDPSQL